MEMEALIVMQWKTRQSHQNASNSALLDTSLCVGQSRSQDSVRDKSEEVVIQREIPAPASFADCCSTPILLGETTWKLSIITGLALASAPPTKIHHRRLFFNRKPRSRSSGAASQYCAPTTIVQYLASSMQEMGFNHNPITFFKLLPPGCIWVLILGSR